MEELKIGQIIKYYFMFGNKLEKRIGILQSTDGANPPNVLYSFTLDGEGGTSNSRFPNDKISNITVLNI